MGIGVYWTPGLGVLETAVFAVMFMVDTSSDGVSTVQTPGLSSLPAVRPLCRAFGFAGSTAAPTAEDPEALCRWASESDLPEMSLPEVGLASQDIGAARAGVRGPPG